MSRPASMFMTAGALVLAAASVANAQPAEGADTFESRATSALRVRHLDDVVWAFTATCDKGDEVQQRQCRHLRDERAHAFAGATLLIDADADAFEVGRYDTQKKSIPVTLSACIRCRTAGLSIDGTPWFVTGQPPRVEGGKVRTGKLYDTARRFSDEASAVAWAKSLKGVRVELLAKLPEKRRWQVSGKDGLLLDVIGYRVIAACDGTVVIANPPSAGVPADRKACTAGATIGDSAGVGVDALTPLMVQAAMKPVVDAANACFERYSVTGNARLNITIASDGTVERYEQTGDFEGTPTGTCIDDAMRGVQFPVSKRERTKIGYPIVLR